MATEMLHMKIGQNLGDILLDIAQSHILKGDLEKGIATYTDSLQGFTKEYALMCLKNEAVLTVDEENQVVNLTDWENEIKANAENIYDWDSIIKNKYEDLKMLIDGYNEITTEFHKHSNSPIYDVNITEVVKRHFGEENMLGIGIHNLAAKLIAGEDFAWDLYGNGSTVWTHLEGDVESDNAKRYQYVLYFVVKYVNLIRQMYNDYINFEKTYNWLLEYDFIKRIPFAEERFERVLNILKEFCNPNTGYYHPMCDEQIYNLKDNILDGLLKTKYGKEYLQNGILKKNIMDGYDAGWLSPDGEYYAGNGETSAMIHMTLAEQILKGNNVYGCRMVKDSVSEWSGTNSPEYWLEKHGWVKIHHNDCYGSFIGEKNPEDRTPDFPYHYCPSEIQIKMICDYADKFYNKKFYTEANTLGRDFHPEPFSTYKVRQMDEIKLHEIFGR